LSSGIGATIDTTVPDLRAKKPAIRSARAVGSLKIVFFANTAWYLFNFRLPYARYLRAMGHEVVMVSPAGEHGPLLQAEGFRWIPLPMARRSLNPLREAMLIAKLAQVYRDEKPDLTHHFTIKCVVYGTLAARAAGVPSVVNAIAGFGHVFVSERLSARLLRPMVRQLMKMAGDRAGTAVIVQNADDLAVFRGLGLSADAKLKLIRGSGVNLNRFRPADEARAPGPLRVLFVGRLLYDKGIAEFVECARRCNRQLPSELAFMAAGEPDTGNPASVEPAVLQKWRSEGDVVFAGQVSDMPSLLANADIVVLPSYGEGAPRSLIEAAACAKPLVATDVRGCREVVIDGHNGLLVPVRDAQKLADAVIRLAGDMQLREAMGRAGRQHVLDELDEQIVFRETYQTYRELMAGLPGYKPSTDAVSIPRLNLRRRLVAQPAPSAAEPVGGPGPAAARNGLEGHDTAHASAKAGAGTVDGETSDRKAA
jgi:glycosyltransferase involved in cell wall biosynthesis